MSQPVLLLPVIAELVLVPKELHSQNVRDESEECCPPSSCFVHLRLIELLGVPLKDCWRSWGECMSESLVCFLHAQQTWYVLRPGQALCPLFFCVVHLREEPSTLRVSVLQPLIPCWSHLTKLKLKFELPMWISPEVRGLQEHLFSLTC